MPVPPTVHYVGLLRSPVSWAKVGRELTLALDRQGVAVSVTPLKGFLHDAGFPLPARLRELCQRTPRGDLQLVYDYPPNYARYTRRPVIGLLVYEATRLPRHWARAAAHHLDLLVVPSRFVEQAAIASGVPSDKVAVAPYGCSADWLDIAPRQRGGAEPYRFLSVVTPHLRKGIGELLRAYCHAFTGHDAVELVIKLPYQAATLPHARPWEDLAWPELLDRLRAGSPCPPRICVRTDPSDDAQVKRLYEQTDCCVQPSWSEGFGLAVLDGMAAGRPCVVTGWGGHMDFCGNRTNLLVRYRLVPAGLRQYDAQEPDAQVAEPDVGHLAQLMRWAFDHPAEAQRMGEHARQVARAWTWDAAANTLMDVLVNRLGTSHRAEPD